MQHCNHRKHNLWPQISYWIPHCLWYVWLHVISLWSIKFYYNWASLGFFKFHWCTHPILRANLCCRLHACIVSKPQGIQEMHFNQVPCSLLSIEWDQHYSLVMRCIWLWCHLILPTLVLHSAIRGYHSQVISLGFQTVNSPWNIPSIWNNKQMEHDYNKLK